MKNLLEDITTAALIGTDRQAFVVPETTGPLGELLGQLASDDPEGMLLRAAGTVALFLQAGRLPQTEDMPLPEPCVLEDKPVCPESVAQMLAPILSGVYDEALPEALTAIARRGWRLPDVLLPEILEQGQRSRFLRNFIVPVLGKRGVWLASLRKEWNYVAGEDDEIVWDESSRAAREAFLRRLRETDPARARELVATTWDTDGADARIDFVNAFEVGLSGDDLAFLEKALNDRSKEVRRIALELLTRLPGSDAEKQAIARAEPMLDLKKSFLGRIDLIVTPIDPTDAQIIAAGLDPKMQVSGGKKSWWLQQVLGSILPSYWSEKWRKSPEDLIQAAVKSEWKDAVLWSWTKAARRCHDADWTLAFLKYAVLGDVPANERTRLDYHVDAVPLDRLEPVILEALKASLMSKPGDRYQPLSDNHPLLPVLRLHARPWSAEISRAFVQSVQLRIAQPRADHTVWTLLYQLKPFAYKIPPALAGELSERWDRDDKNWPQWERHVDEFLGVLRFRQDLLKEINHS